MDTQCIKISRPLTLRKILVESTPIKEGTKLSVSNSLEGIKGFTGIFNVDWG